MSEWRDIPGFDGYQASDDGCVRRNFVGRHGHPAKVLRPAVESNGYLSVGIRRVGIARKTYAVHRLVCAAFHGPPPTSEYQVAHSDGSRTNNAPSNLRWATGKENAGDRRVHGNQRFGEAVNTAKLKPSDIPLVFKLANGGMYQRDIAARFGVHQRQIFNILHKHTWKHISVPLGLTRLEAATPLFGKAHAVEGAA